MKNADYMGKTFYVQDAVNYLAADSNGKVFGYKHIPDWNEDNQSYNDGGRGDWWYVGEIDELRYPVLCV